MKQNKYCLYMQKLYISAGKTVMDRLFSISSPYTDYKTLNSLYDKIIASPCNIKLEISDCYGAFFHRLCCRLAKEIYADSTVYYILSPCHGKDVICRMIVPEKCCIFSNNYPNYNCKAKVLYSTDSIADYTVYLHFAEELFRKSEKIQQEFTP